MSIFHGRNPPKSKITFSPLPSPLFIASCQNILWPVTFLFNGLSSQGSNYYFAPSSLFVTMNSPSKWSYLDKEDI